MDSALSGGGAACLRRRVKKSLRCVNRYFERLRAVAQVGKNGVGVGRETSRSYLQGARGLDCSLLVDQPTACSTVKGVRAKPDDAEQHPAM